MLRYWILKILLRNNYTEENIKKLSQGKAGILTLTVEDDENIAKYMANMINYGRSTMKVEVLDEVMGDAE